MISNCTPLLMILEYQPLMKNRLSNESFHSSFGNLQSAPNENPLPLLRQGEIVLNKADNFYSQMTFNPLLFSPQR